MPLRYRLYNEEPWDSIRIRFVPIDGYLVFYLPEEMKGL